MYTREWKVYIKHVDPILRGPPEDQKTVGSLVTKHLGCVVCVIIYRLSEFRRWVQS
jgi:hypothetical protein